MIQAEHITRRYGAFEALKDLTFSVNIGEVAGLLGQNGAGKTTALHVLSGYLAPSAGSVRINGIDLAKRPGEAKRHIGYLPESIPLYPEMTPLEYLRFCCEIKRVHRQDREGHIQEIMELTDITQIRSQLSGTLSKGYRQRLGLAQALCGNPEALFLDEPTAGFDPVQSSAFRKLIRRLAKKHAIILYSHLLSEVKEVCDRILVLASGQLVLDRAARDGSDRQSRFRLVVAAPASLVLPPLRQLPGVRRAEAMGRGSPEMTTLFIETSKDSAFQHALSKLLCGLSVTTMELSPLGNSLEDLFLRVSSGQVPEENP